MHPKKPSRRKLTWHDVDLIRELHEDHGIGYRQLVKKFEVSKSVIRRICNYQSWTRQYAPHEGGALAASD